jgi:hypothetical protein
MAEARMYSLLQRPLRFKGDLPAELEMPKNHQENCQTEKTTEKDKGDFEKRTEKILPQTCGCFRADPCSPVHCTGPGTLCQRCSAVTAEVVGIIHCKFAILARYLHRSMVISFPQIEAISKKSFRPISALSPRLKSSTYLSMRVEDPVNGRGGLILGPAFLSRRSWAGDLDRKS